jgi:hypothetical protein
MRDIRELLEHAASRIVGKPDALGRTLERTRRRRRARRLGVAMFALLLSAASLSWLATSLTLLGQPSRPGGSSSRPPAAESPSTSDSVPAATGSTTASATPPPTTEPPLVPSRIIGLTADGEVVVVSTRNGTVEPPLAQFPPSSDPDNTGLGTSAIDIEVAPSGEIFVVTCCEPAAGAVFIIDRTGEHIGTWNALGIDVLATTGAIAVAEIDGMTLVSSIAGSERRSIPSGGTLDPPEWPAWDPNGEQLIYAAGGRLYSVAASASSLDAGMSLEGTEEGSWYSPAVSRDGVVAIRSGQSWTRIGAVPRGPSSVVMIDSHGELTILYESSDGVSSLEVSPDGAHLLWVDGGDLVWSDEHGTHMIEGNFVAATWMPDR